MSPEDVIVEVRDQNLQRLGTIKPEHRRLRGTPRFRGVGTWSLELPTEHDLAGELRQPGAGILVTGPDDVWWSGPVTEPALEAGTRDPRGTLRVGGVTDDVVLADALAWPQPSNPNVSTQSVAHDDRWGAAEGVMRAYVNANIGPGAPAARRGHLASFLTLAPNQGRGRIVEAQPRFQNLAELLGQIGTLAGLGFRVVQRGSVLVFEIVEPTDRTRLVRLDVRNGGLSSQNVATAPPTVTRVIVAGQGQGEERTLLSRTSADAIAAETAWGRIVERFKDQRQTNDTASLEQAGDEDLADGGFTATNVSVVPGTESDLEFGKDWNLGDPITVVVEGQETTSTVTEATVLADAKGLRIGMGIGDVAGFNITAALEGRVDDTARRVSALERNAELPTDLVTKAYVDGNFVQDAGEMGARIGGDYPIGLFLRPANIDSRLNDGTGQVLYVNQSGGMVVVGHSHNTAMIQINAHSVAVGGENGNSLNVRTPNVQLSKVTTSTSSGGVYMNSIGQIYRSTSTRDTKVLIEDAPAAWVESVYALRPRTWFDRVQAEEWADYETALANGEVPPEIDPDPLERVPGFVAEEVAAAGLDEFVLHDAERNIRGVAYDRVSAVLVLAVQAHKAQLDGQAAELSALHAEVTELRERAAGLDQQLAGQAQSITDLAARVAALENGATT